MKIGIRCSTWDGIETFSVEGHKVSEFLAVTQHHNSRLWMVTHIPTGYSTCGAYPSKAKALLMAKKIKDLDWNFKSPKSPKLRKLRVMMEIISGGTYDRSRT